MNIKDKIIYARGRYTAALIVGSKIEEERWAKAIDELEAERKGDTDCSPVCAE